MISQTAQFMGMGAPELYDAYLSSEHHQAMTADGNQRTTFHRAPLGNIGRGEVGDELHAFASPGAGEPAEYALTARILDLEPGRLVVMSWKNKVWDMAINRDEVTDLPSTVVLTFSNNMAGAEINLVQTNVPNYKVHIPDTGEVGPLSEIVNTHWNLLYWEPMKRYFARS